MDRDEGKANDLELDITPQGDAGAGEGSGEDEVYALRAEPLPPKPAAEYAAGRDYREKPAEVEEPEEEEDEESAWLNVGGPPAGLFSTGTFNFPFHPSAQMHSLTLVGGAMAMLVLFRLAFLTGSVGAENGLVSVGAWTGSVVFGGLGAIFALAWICVASAYGLAIVRDASNGCDAVADWPLPYSLDSLGDAVYMFNGAAIGVLPVMVFAPLWDWLGWPKLAMMLLSALILFPVSLLSMLEANSPMMPFSPLVWRSVGRAWRAWGLFYAITLPAVAFVFFLTGVLLTARYGGILSALVTAPLVAAAWMIYFRLLGRLAWFCSGRSAEE